MKYENFIRNVVETIRKFIGISITFHIGQITKVSTNYTHCFAFSGMLT